ncbi:hypothetical protein [Rheinheimera hassiensis]|uniref:hypothetical protein n=1 Tax=Rheinheimera hassiensis TaxID=1193627 RepID=UPI001F05F21E|nr:hypothetical protein [Rheinheimera hassiensis]
MAYPSLEQYNNAFSVHSRLLTDTELRTGTLATTGLGLPLAISGGFALTYTISNSTKKYAVRCFHRESKALEPRYQAISRRLSTLRSPYFLEFQFQPKGIVVDGHHYPIVKMAWAKGETLGEFLENNYRNSFTINNLLKSLENLASFLEKENIAHGDLQTGNLMVSNQGTEIQLIDYDGMFVEDIRSLGSTELGHVNFQHPGRKITNPFNAKLDRFSLILLWLALKSLAEKSEIWSQTKSEVDAIVFRANDFLDPNSSKTFRLLTGIKSLEKYAKDFAAVCFATIDKAPALSDFILGKNIPSAVRTSTSSFTKPGAFKPAYISAYSVVSANDYQECLGKVGDKVEAIGKIIEVKFGKVKKTGKPYIFINFGDWRGQTFKVSIWSDTLKTMHTKPDQSWEGQWLRIVGLMQPPYRKFTYTHLSINITNSGQMELLDEHEAKWRLSKEVAPSPNYSANNLSSNQQILSDIKNNGATREVAKQPQYTVNRNQNTLNNKAILDQIRGAAASKTLGAVQPKATYNASSSNQINQQHQPKEQPRESNSNAKTIGWIVFFIIIIFIALT